MKARLTYFGMLLISCFYLSISCSKDSTDDIDDDPDDKPDPTEITAKFYFQAKINDTIITFQDGKDGYGSGSGNTGGSVHSGYQEVQYGILTTYFVTKNIGGFEIMKTFQDTYVPGEEIENMFKVQSYPYGKVGDYETDGIDGAAVFYYDNNGVEWRTDLGSADQTGSSFSITEHIANTDGFSHRISKAEFKCTLYNSDGVSMELTDGICRSRTVLY